MTETLSKRMTAKKLITYIAVFLAMVVLFGYLYVNSKLKSSLALLDGTLDSKDLSADVIIERDKQGIPTLQGQSRADIAYGLGVLHGQERFFQMDLLRRNSAGELNQLFGEIAEPLDIKNRIHQFRKRAQRAYELMPAEQKQLVDAYVSGVNFGLSNLDEFPFEYLLISKEPAPWVAADTYLVLYSMYMDLQHEQGEYERSLAVLKDHLPKDWFEFLKPQAVQMAELDWEAPITEYQYGSLQLPSSSYPVTEFEGAKTAEETAAVQSIKHSSNTFTLAANQNDQATEILLRSTPTLPEDQGVPGSNNWGVSGAMTSTGAAMVANDMHLGIRVPNIWYRASWFHPTDGRRVTGATLPGTPVMVVGSNEHVSWGFTNSYGDWYDLVALRLSEDQTQYLTPDGFKSFEIDKETVGSQELEVKKTIWGPVIGKDHLGNDLVMHWVAHSELGANLKLMNMELANSVDDVPAIANGAGVPAQNMMVGDKAGKLAWILTGAVPDREMTTDTYILDWSKTGSTWKGFVSQELQPMISSNDGRLWTANSRVVSDEQYPRVGDGGYDIGIRSKIIADRLTKKQQFSEKDLLTIALDTHNPLLEKWKQLFEEVVQASNNNDDKAMLAALAKWDGKAEIDSVSYGLIRQYRKEVLDRTMGPIYKPFIEQYPSTFFYRTVDNHIDNPLWLLVTQQPANGLNPEFDSWQDLLLQAAQAAFASQNSGNKTWGDDSILKVQHPISRSVTLLSGFLDMPYEAVPGDRNNVVRIQGPAFGASERMIVSPGNEANGIFHMATGQSGHPLSPFYELGHQDWVQGKPSPFLPGKTQYRLILKASKQ